MATVEEPRTFIRPDGKEKVTGTGRYTADLVLAGQLVAKFRYADHAHARITRIDATKARALPGVLAVVTHEDVPDVLYGGMVKDRRLFAKDTVRFEGDVVAGVAATTAEIAEQAAALIEVDYEPLPVVTDFEAALADDATLVHPDWESYEGSKALGRHDNTLGYSTIVKGDVDAALAAADVVVKGRYETDSVNGVPIEPRAVVAQWQGDKVTVWTSTQVPYAARGGIARHAPDPGVARARDRAAARRRLRRQVRLPLRGARGGARAGSAPAGQARLLPPRGVRRRRSPPRGHGDRARDRRPRRRHARRAQGAARARQGRVLRRGRLLRADGGDARARAVRARERPRRVVARLLEQPAVVLDPRPDGAAGVLGARAAHGRARRGARHRSGRPPSPHADRDGLGHGDRPGARADRDEGDAREGGRADRLRPGAARRRGDRRLGRLVAVLRLAERRLREAQPRRHRHDHHRRAGERHRRRDGDAEVRGRAARDAAGGLLAPLPGHRRGAVRHGLVRLADDVQQRPRRDRRGRRPARAAARRGRGGARGIEGRPRAPRRRDPRQGLARQVDHDREAGGRRHLPRQGRRRGAGRRPRRSPPRAASAGSGSSRSTRRS